MATVKQERLGTARSLFTNPPKDETNLAEAANYLKTQLKLTRAEVSTVLKITERRVLTLATTFKKLSALGHIPTGNLPIQYAEAPKVAVQKDEEERLKRGLERTEAAQAVEANIFEERFAKAVAPHLPTARSMAHVDKLAAEIKKTRKIVQGDEEAVLASISDLHLGCVNSEFNVEIAKQALNRYFDKVLLLTELHRSQCPVNKIYLWLGGDLIEGSSANFPSQRWNVHETATEQLELLIEASVKLIEKALVNYDEVDVIVSPGNHENCYPSKTSVEPAHSNLSLVMGRTLQWAFRDNNRVKFHIPKEWFQVLQVEGVRILFTHGHALSGAGSLDGTVNAFRKLSDILPHYDVAHIGHFHRLCRLSLPSPYGVSGSRAVYMNGTAKLGDDFGQKMGLGHSNQWWCQFVNNKRITASYDVALYD